VNARAFPRKGEKIAFAAVGNGVGEGMFVGKMNIGLIRQGKGYTGSQM
jgi:hypothetical protein